MLNFRCLSVVLTLMLVVTSFVDAQTSPRVNKGSKTPLHELMKLRIGMKAPPISVQHWLSNGEGTLPEVRAFEKDKVYVIEFWATWCGPCVSSMPVLAKTQEKYKDQGLQIISISDESLDTVVEFLKKPVPNNKDNLTFAELTKSYCLTTDPDHSVKDDYFQATLQTGIPCAIIVGKTGLVEWIGHPVALNNVLEQVMSGSWDREKFNKGYEGNKIYFSMVTQVSKLMREKKTGQALEFFNKYDYYEYPEFSVPFLSKHVDTLLSANKVTEARALVNKEKPKFDKEKQVEVEIIKLKILANSSTNGDNIVRELKKFMDSPEVTDKHRKTLISFFTSFVSDGLIKPKNVGDYIYETGRQLVEKSGDKDSFFLLVDLAELSALRNDTAQSITYLERALAVSISPYYTDKIKEKIEDLKKKK